METYVLRLWLPDRPGALGLVATRIGAVRGDVLSIEIIERDGGQAIDELVVALPDGGLVPLMLTEIAEVDGVAVEDIWAVGSGRPTREAQLLDLVETLVVADPDKRLPMLCEGVQTALDADWTVALAGTPSSVRAAAGSLPDEAWLTAFLDGARFQEAAEPAPADIGWSACGDVTIAVGRARWALRTSERAHLKQLARIAAALEQG